MPPSLDRASRALGLLALFSGAALLTHIVAGVSLRLAIGLAAVVLFFGLGAVWARATPKKRERLTKFIKVGVSAGILATVAYDLSKFALSHWDPSPFNPFEAIRIFGVLLVGDPAGSATVYLAGTAFHALNGVSFGVAFCFLFGGRGILAGIAWGLFLELFQVTLYPGWMDVRFYREFVQISGLSHVVYGAVLAYSCQLGLRQKRV